MKNSLRLDQEPSQISADDQGEFLRAVMSEARITRQQLAEHLLVSKRTVDAWLLPSESLGFRHISYIHSQWAVSLLQHEMFIREYKPCVGLIAPGFEPRELCGLDGKQQRYPSVFWDKKKGIYSFENSKGATPLDHLPALNPDNFWMVITSSLSLEDVHNYVENTCQFRSSAARKSLSVCTFESVYVSLLLLPVPPSAKHSRLTLYLMNENTFLGKPADRLMVLDQDGGRVKGRISDFYF